MCGRFTLHHNLEEIEERFACEAAEETRLAAVPRYNVAPTQNVLVVTQNGSRHLHSAHWGLIPSWAKDAAIGSKMINARAETLAERPAFRTALARRRCLIPADGFYEWQAAPDGKTVDGKKAGRTPMHIRRKDGGLFAFAGLWEEWQAPNGSPLRSCTIITTTPNAVVAPIHDRMPALLRPEDEHHWLDPSVTQAADLLALLAPYPAGELAPYPAGELAPYPAGEMEAYAVGRQVNAPTVDDPLCIAPVQ